MWTVGMLTIGGCKPRAAPPAPVRAAYDGPLLPVERVVAKLAERAATVRTVWARHDYVVSLLDERGRVRSFDGEGVLLLRKPPAGGPNGPPGGPIELRLQGQKDVLGTVFDLGSNRDRAWLILFADIDTMYWTEHRSDPFDLEPPVEGAEATPGGVPARPELLAEVLGVSDWSTDLTRYPTPVLRYDSAEDAYVLTLVEPSAMGTHLLSRREYWADRASLNVKRVVLRSGDGREVVRAELAGYVGPGEGLPIARDITVSFPRSQTTLRLTLRSVAERRGQLPGDVSFRFPEPPPVPRVVRVRGD